MGRDYFDRNIKAADQSEIRVHVKGTDGARGHREREPTDWSTSFKKRHIFNLFKVENLPFSFLPFLFFRYFESYLIP